MRRNATLKTNALFCLSLIVTGVGIGWLVGLSVSPVVSTVVASVAGSAAAIVAALSGLRDEAAEEAKSGDKPKRLRMEVDPLPIAMLVIGLIGGSTVGIWARTHDWLGPSVSASSDEIAWWTAEGLPRMTVVNRLFESRYPSSGTAQQGAAARLTILYSQKARDECENLKALVAKQDYKDLVTNLSSSLVPPFQELPEIVTDTVKLAQIVERVLCTDTSQ